MGFAATFRSSVSCVRYPALIEKHLLLVGFPGIPDDVLMLCRLYTSLPRQSISSFSGKIKKATNYRKSSRSDVLK
jgi:hypothetical protein